MSHPTVKRLASLELEEKILNGGALLAIVGIFFPWIGGEWFGGEAILHSGFGFYTGWIGWTILLLLIFLLSLIVVPFFGGPSLVKRRHREFVRLCVASQVVVLTLASLSVLARVTAEFSRLEIRFGIIITMVSSMVTLLYSFLRYQEQRRLESQELFHHPEDQEPLPEQNDTLVRSVPPPPPPPPPLPPEDHRLMP